MSPERSPQPHNHRLRDRLKKLGSIAGNAAHAHGSSHEGRGKTTREIVDSLSTVGHSYDVEWQTHTFQFPHEPFGQTPETTKRNSPERQRKHFRAALTKAGVPAPQELTLPDGRVIPDRFVIEEGTNMYIKSVPSVNDKVVEAVQDLWQSQHPEIILGPSMVIIRPIENLQ